MMRLSKCLFLYLFFFLMIACERQLLYDACKHKTALIPVKIDWIYSGINPELADEDDFVHKVSFRFFPKDGGQPFELYLEGNVHEGYLEVPIGDYDLLVMNESVIEDYWKEFVSFSDINHFEGISAEIKAMDPTPFEFYKAAVDEKFVADMPKMASWSVRDYSITFETVNDTRKNESSDRQKHALHVPMQRLTHDCKVIATVKNLKYAQLMRGAQRLFANKVYLSSRKTYASPATHLFTLNGRKTINGSLTDGTTERIFRTFGILPVPAQYTLGVDIILTDGCRYVPSDGGKLEYNVTDYVNSYFGKSLEDRLLKDYIEIPLFFSLPQVDGGIDVGDWGDDEDIIIK